MIQCSLHDWSNSTYYQKCQQDTWEYIEQGIVKYSALGNILICGDLNARTGSQLNFIQNDEQCNISENLYYELDEASCRSSQDTVVCSWGRTILETCISEKHWIVNSRKLGDSIGKFTCHKWNGSSVVDYLITEENVCGIFISKLITVMVKSKSLLWWWVKWA